ncbi:hypothetical protein [Qipengyuania qiaonensis]|uniref:Uncharacterized protein n=1 Tax=Qipengyuania qiaonensis TaxID=2867240 RepID=A0ABS7J490_9SPHN|nr:hypothetical protein [Qipengyuania qiaonensis]MBX7481698.1 hypothetical protein [Qipengyuania qiaonensis]
MTELAATLYLPALIAHSAWRWVVLALLVWAMLAAFTGRRARLAARFAVPAADMQLTLGLLLYLWLSPLGSGAMTAGDLTGEAGFFAIFHFAAMVIALVVIHVAGISVRRSLERRGGVLFAAALLLTLVAIPWWRPLLRF